ncbi:MAG: hypothetical protein E7632_11140, partial [Ruminococcaceae bacterium]|nr:hypothetical protein [Oscillospiraceae bacterium]
MMLSASYALFDSISEQTAKLRGEILAAESCPLPHGRRFYLAPDGDDLLPGTTPETAWRSLDRLEKETFLPGDAVLFERGGSWRGRFRAMGGVTYSAFGDGAKPRIIGSPENGADPEKWQEVAPDVWRYQTKFAADVGGIVMNGGERHARKIVLDYSGLAPVDFVTKQPFGGYAELAEDLVMWHDLGGDVVENADGGWLYLCSKKGNPGARFREIEFL